MINFTERIKNIKKECKRKISYERLAEYHLRAISHLLKIDSVSTYAKSMFVYVTAKSIEEAELEIIPLLSDIYQYGIWTRTVSETQVAYEADFSSFGYTIHIRLFWEDNDTNTCKIKAYPTGNIRTVSKTIEVQEPEMEFKIQCS
ncbi:MAG: hypothetical protein SVO01_00700 [Thermotogota bacterium]|nr:hypothetical protein [Thermotogota bacterium]